MGRTISEWSVELAGEKKNHFQLVCFISGSAQQGSAKSLLAPDVLFDTNRPEIWGTKWCQTQSRRQTTFLNQTTVLLKKVDVFIFGSLFNNNVIRWGCCHLGIAEMRDC